MNFTEFLLTIPVLVNLYADNYYQNDKTHSLVELSNEFNVPKIKVYDFIIVGGGTAGCVLAGRLSNEYAMGNILLLEAGGDPPPAAAVPHFAEVVGLAPNINYFFESVPMTNASLKNGGIVINHTGKMLGGSGSHNEMVHSRGSPKDFDNWAEITKDDSWTYANVLQYFKKSENFVGRQYGNDNFEANQIALSSQKCILVMAYNFKFNIRVS